MKVLALVIILLTTNLFGTSIESIYADLKSLDPVREEKGLLNLLENKTSSWAGDLLYKIRIATNI